MRSVFAVVGLAIVCVAATSDAGTVAARDLSIDGSSYPIVVEQAPVEKAYRPTGEFVEVNSKDAPEDIDSSVHHVNDAVFLSAQEKFDIARAAFYDSCDPEEKARHARKMVHAAEPIMWRMYHKIEYYQHSLKDAELALL